DPAGGRPVYAIDGCAPPASTGDALPRRARKVICSLSPGAWEDGRPGGGKFPAAVLGQGTGWDAGRWLDIRRTAVGGPLRATRL
ncbi:endo alpha-1,4 polygalactosaminidase, partial [Streptomyces noursei]|uniref:endo alpha-1,4 polygalactosaminidase n=1 Tax=Streptomyces noursei TaxID=1971 RepID=UPI000A4DB9B4